MSAAAAGFGLAEEDLVAVVRAAPSMRPDRYTILSETAPAAVEPAVRDVLSSL